MENNTRLTVNTEDYANTPMIDRIPVWRELYNAAQKADEAFEEALAAQFGNDGNNGDIRYRISKHNAETRQAGLAYEMACKALSNMNEYYRTHSQEVR